MRWITLPLLCAALWLTGCASTRLVDSDVQSFSQLAGAPARAPTLLSACRRSKPRAPSSRPWKNRPG